MSLVSDKSQPALVAEVHSMMDVPPTQEDIEMSRYDVYPSLMSTVGTSDIEFTIPSASDNFLTDLSQSYIKYDLTTSLNVNRTPAADNVYVPLPGLGNTIFERVSLSANGTLISDETSGQPYMTHVMDLLNKSRRQYLADAHGWVPTPANGHDAERSIVSQAEYAGSTQSYPDFFALPMTAAAPLRHGKVVPLGDLFGVAGAKRFWPDRCAFRMRLTRQPDAMLYSKQGTTIAAFVSFVINKAEVHIRRVRLTENASTHLMAELALNKTVDIPHLNPRLAQVNFQPGLTQLVARGVLPGARPSRVIAFITVTGNMTAARAWNTMPFCMHDPAHPTSFVTRAFAEVAGQTFPNRYLTSTQVVAPGGWSNADVGAAYNAYRAIAHPNDPVLGERDFYGKQMYCFDTSVSGTSGETLYDPTEQTDVTVTLDYAVATGSALTLNILTLTPRVIEIDQGREVTRV